MLKFIVVCFLCAIVNSQYSRNISPYSNEHPTSYQDTETLFADFPYVTQLWTNASPGKNDEFNSNIYYSSKPWLIFFYAHWCGHCQNYAPMFRRFVLDTELNYKNQQISWQNVIKIGVVNCGHSTRAKRVCSEQGVRGYPKLKFYPANLSPKKEVSGSYRRGIDTTSQKYPKKLKSATIAFLEESQNNWAKRDYMNGNNIIFKGWSASWNYPSAQPAPLVSYKNSLVARNLLKSTWILF